MIHFNPGESGASLDVSTVYTFGDATPHTDEASQSGLRVQNSSVSVSVKSTGSTETAPKHMMMRYFIRARH